jgi:hypothetical protein
VCWVVWCRQSDHSAQNVVELLCIVVRLSECLFVIGIGEWLDVGKKTRVPTLRIFWFANVLV